MPATELGINGKLKSPCPPGVYSLLSKTKKQTFNQSTMQITNKMAKPDLEGSDKVSEEVKFTLRFIR